MTYLQCLHRQWQQPSKWVIRLVLLVGLLAYASGAIFVRLAIAYDGAEGLGFSLFLAASRMAITALCFGFAWRGFARAKYATEDLCNSILAGGCLALYFATWMTSLSFTSIAASTTLVNLNPLWVMLLAWLWLHYRPKTITLGGVSVAIAGVVIISSGANAVAGDATNMGNLLALIGSFAIAAYIFLGHVAQKTRIRFNHHIVLTYSSAALILLPLPLLLKTHYWGHSWQTYGCITLMALCTQILGHTCLNWSMKWVNPTLLSILLLTEPIVASGLGYFVFRESPALSVIFGGSVLMLGVAIALLCQGASLPKQAQEVAP
ncbi:MAG: DMT family transporter [Leptolyngbyaceae cyanobacterium MAG.088]|nr:DMT family transporter [Leptolyngbyaceae cyanobacterium MAG.088]